MAAEMTLRALNDDTAVINLQIPTREANRIAEAIRHLLAFGGQEVQWVDEAGESLLGVEEVFPELSPAKVLRGLRGKEELTQVEIAARLGLSQHHISEMENGKRGISVEMAKRIGEAFNVSYKMFL